MEIITSKSEEGECDLITRCDKVATMSRNTHSSSFFVSSADYFHFLLLLS
jgi:hypothetical protein